jgi:hypothetical protein
VQHTRYVTDTSYVWCVFTWASLAPLLPRQFPGLVAMQLLTSCGIILSTLICGLPSFKKFIGLLTCVFIFKIPPIYPCNLESNFIFREKLQLLQLNDNLSTHLWTQKHTLSLAKNL